MIDLKLNTVTGDLVIDGGDLNFARGRDVVAQLIGTSLRFQKGAWFRDTRIGTPIVPNVLGIKNNLPLATATIKAAIESVPGVVEVTKLTVDLDANRNFQVNWEVRENDDGTLIAGSNTLIFGE